MKLPFLLALAALMVATANAASTITTPVNPTTVDPTPVVKTERKPDGDDADRPRKHHHHRHHHHKKGEAAEEAAEKGGAKKASATDKDGISKPAVNPSATV
jgi:hypothetical protein